MALYGVEPWTRSGDGFGVYFGLFARALAAALARPRRCRVRRAAVGRRPQLRPVPGTVALLAVAIGTTTFDGLAENSFWTDAGARHPGRARGRRPQRDARRSRSRTRSACSPWSCCSPACCSGSASRACARSTGAHGRPSSRGASRTRSSRSRFAYVLAHYFSLLAYQGQATALPGVRPARQGLGPLRHRRPRRSTTRSSRRNGIWYVQVGALVLGHVAGLVLAHDRALVVFDDPRVRDALAVLDARGDGGVHLARPVAPLGGERLMLPLAHAGHWLAEAAYVAAGARGRRLDLGQGAARTGGADAPPPLPTLASSSRCRAPAPRA